MFNDVCVICFQIFIFPEKHINKLLKILTYLALCSVDKLLDNLTYFGSSSVPKFHSVTSSFSFEPLTFTTTSFLSNNLSKGTSPFGIWLLGD
jgi:hypothetical protein